MEISPRVTFVDNNKITLARRNILSFTCPSGDLLQKMARAYTRDNLRKLVFNSEIFPLVLKFQNGDRSKSLFEAILNSEKFLMKDFSQRLSLGECSGGFFVNPRLKPTYSDVLAILGKERVKWQNLFHLFKSDFRLKVKLKFYSDSDVWAFQFFQGRSLKILLIPDKDNFRLKIPEIREEYFDAAEFQDYHNTLIPPYHHQTIQHVNDLSLTAETPLQKIEYALRIGLQDS